MKLKGLGLFGLQVIGLISSGKKEKLNLIEGHMEASNLVEYINNKYNDCLGVDFSNGVYDLQALNKYFNNFASYVHGNESRKFSIQNDDDGLLLIVALVNECVNQKCHNWDVE